MADRKSYHHGDLPQALRNATLEILSELGVDGFTLREAARRVGVNHRAVYRHFEDKLALLADISEEGYRGLAAAMRAALAEQPVEDIESRLVIIAQGYLRFARKEPARYQVMFGPRLNTDGRFVDLEKAISDALLVVRDELRRAGPSATSIARRDAGITLWSAVHGLTSLVLTGKVPLAERHLARYVDTIMRPVARGLVTMLAAASAS